MTQNLNLSLLAKYANSAGQIATSGISGGLPLANGGTQNDNFNATAGGVVGVTGVGLQGNGGGGTSGHILKYTGSIPAWGEGSASGMVLLQTTFMNSSGHYITPGSATVSIYKTIYLFFNNVTIGGNGAFSMGAATLYTPQGGMNTSGLYGGFVINVNTGVAAGCIGRGTMGSDYFFAAVNSTNISSQPMGLFFSNGMNLFTGGYVYCYGQK